MILKDTFTSYFTPRIMNRSDTGISILKKWSNRGSQVIRFINGDIEDTSSSNMCYVEVVDAIASFDTWVTDWDSGLTEEEKALVQDKS